MDRLARLLSRTEAGKGERKGRSIASAEFDELAALVEIAKLRQS
jgi:hypothetical protein